MSWYCNGVMEASTSLAHFFVRGVGFAVEGVGGDLRPAAGIAGSGAMRMRLSSMLATLTRVAEWLAGEVGAETFFDGGAQRFFRRRGMAVSFDAVERVVTEVLGV